MIDPKQVADALMTAEPERRPIRPITDGSATRIGPGTRRVRRPRCLPGAVRITNIIIELQEGDLKQVPLLGFNFGRH